MNSMKRRPLFFALVLALGLTACGAVPPVGADDPVPSSTPIPIPSLTATPEPPSMESVVYAADVPPGDYAPWQTAYADFLAETAARDYPPVDQMVVAEALEQSDNYSLYDVDKDGIPELFISYGLGEADYHTTCYTFRDGEVAEAGDFPSGHASLHSYPEENGVLFLWRHMGSAHMDRLVIADGELTNLGEVFSEDINASQQSEYTASGQVVPGSRPLGEYATHTVRDRRWSETLTLPVYDYNALPRLLEAPLEESEVRAAVGRVLWENGEFCGIAGEGFYGDTGSTTLEEYLQPGAAYPYSGNPLLPKEYAFADVNGDGQTDCVLRLERAEEDNTLTFFAVFHVREDMVYAYFFGFTDGVGVDPDGTVYFRQSGDWNQVSFYKDQCYDFPAPREPVEGCDLAWDKYAPNP